MEERGEVGRWREVGRWSEVGRWREVGRWSEESTKEALCGI